MCDRINVRVNYKGKGEYLWHCRYYDLNGETGIYDRGIIPEVHAERILADRGGIEPVRGKEEIVERFIAQCRLKGIFPNLRIKEK